MKLAPVNIKNKRATFDYELLDTYTAGIVLTGTEIKSIRLGRICTLPNISMARTIIMQPVETGSYYSIRRS